MAVALVLSGGGSRGDFQVGALRRLYDDGIRPELIASTSVGSVNAIKLAEGEGPGDAGGLAPGLSGLEQLWLGLTSNSDMWEPEPWYVGLPDNAVVRFFKKSTEAKIAWSAAIPGALIFGGPLGWIAGIGLAVKTAIDLEDFRQLLEKVQAATSISNLNPIRDKLRDPANLDLTRVRDSAIKLRMAVVGLNSGELRYITEEGMVLDRAGQASVLGSHAGVAPACRASWDALTLAQARLDVAIDRVDDPKHQPRPGASLAELVADRGAAQAELTACETANPPPVLQDTVSVLDGVLASAAIPFAFPPVALGGASAAGDVYCDGGVREVLPITITERVPGVSFERVFAICASAPGAPPPQAFDLGGDVTLLDMRDAGLLDIANRVARELLVNEVTIDETDPPGGGWGPEVTIIEPGFDIHDIMTIDPGLIRIRIAYGFMRADDVLAAKAQEPTSTAYRALSDTLSRDRSTDAIIRKRHEIWALEQEVISPWSLGVNGLARLPELMSAKQQLAELVAARRATPGALPADADSWARQWEAHPWPPVVAFSNGAPLRNDAGMMAQSVPLSIQAGGSAEVSVTMRNAGSTTWEPAAGYGLGSQSPQDSQTWGTRRVPLPQLTRPGEDAVFVFTITAPVQPGGHAFQWQMVQDGVAWFGDATEALTVVSTPATEPPRCGELRRTIFDIDGEIAALTELLTGDPRLDGARLRAIARLRTRRAAQASEAEGLGCAL